MRTISLLFAPAEIYLSLGNKNWVNITLSQYDLSIWDVVQKGWKKPQGEIRRHSPSPLIDLLDFIQAAHFGISVPLSPRLSSVSQTVDILTISTLAPNASVTKKRHGCMSDMDFFSMVLIHDYLNNQVLFPDYPQEWNLDQVQGESQRAVGALRYACITGFLSISTPV